MAATFRPVNTPLAMEAASQNDRSMAATQSTPTPTKSTFGQRPLPTSPFPQAVQIPDSIEEGKSPQRKNSPSSRKSGEPEDVDMEESDGEGHGEDGAGSDEESVTTDGTRSNKKKKSQRFYCTDYPPCNLSFTRSEHLARHIRKHTGERPFTCHCGRRFSRLDNLRQHAQTVHVNEDIPMDSLAATGTRFQRQIRTDRVRAQGGRARASTAGSVGAASRGHSKSLSTSSISSIGSNFSARSRPPPLVMADPRSRLSLESYHSAADSQFSYRPASPSDFSTPTSATFSTGQNSPRWASGIGSPITTHSRSQSLYTAGSQAQGRRLSVPSGGNPFQSPHGTSPGRSLFGPGPFNSSHASAFPPTASVAHSPTSSVFSRREAASNAADDAWRRRTWHPDTNNYSIATTSSRLSNVVTPSQIQSPVIGPVSMGTPSAPNTPLRLPGIESFDSVPRRAVSPPRRNPSPMMIDSEAAHPPALLPAADANSDDRRGVANWDMGLHRGLTRLDITANNTTPPRDVTGKWAQEVDQAVQAEVERARARANPPIVRFNDTVTIQSNNATSDGNNRAYHQHATSAPSVSTSRESKRHGWYRGPAPVHADAQPSKTARVERMVHPNITEFPAFPARESTAVQHQPQQPQPQQQPQQLQAANSDEKDNMLRLQALVAVATSENSAATAY